MRPTELITPTASKTRLKIKWLNLAPLDGLLLVAGLVAAWLPVDWTRDLKRIKQAPLYAWQSLGYFLVYALGVWWAFRPGANDKNYRGKWLALAALVILPNLFNIWLRTNSKLPDGSLLFGQEPDMAIFSKYGQDFMQGRYPVNIRGEYMEYPQFALFLFWFGALLSGGRQADFNWYFPLIMTGFQLIAAFAVYGIGRKLGQARAGFLVAAFVSSCPALFSFNATRFDAAPAAVLLLAVYSFLPRLTPEVRPGASAETFLNPTLGVEEKPQATLSWRRAGLVGGLVASGGLLKWLPAVITPWLVAAYLQARRWRDLVSFAVAGLVIGLVTLVPFYLWNSEAFWYPYKFQGSRKLIGESFWFLIQRDFLDPAHTTPEKPWGEPAKVILGNNKLLFAQLALTLLVLALSLVRLWWAQRKQVTIDWAGWAGAGLVGVAVFTLANRVFSPQYMILLAWVWVAALVLRPVGRFGLLFGLGLLSVAATCNFQVFLLAVYPEEWLRDSWILFGAAWLLCGWLLWKALAPKKSVSPDISNE